MPNLLSDLIIKMVGQNRAPNTLRLRNLYDKYYINEQTNGRDPQEFEQWAQMNYPDYKILNQQSQQGY